MHSLTCRSFISREADGHCSLKFISHTNPLSSTKNNSCPTPFNILFPAPPLSTPSLLAFLIFSLSHFLPSHPLFLISCLSHSFFSHISLHPTLSYWLPSSSTSSILPSLIFSLPLLFPAPFSPSYLFSQPKVPPTCLEVIKTGMTMFSVQPFPVKEIIAAMGPVLNGTNGVSICPIIV